MKGISMHASVQFGHLYRFQFNKSFDIPNSPGLQKYLQSDGPEGVQHIWEKPGDPRDIYQIVSDNLARLDGSNTRVVTGHRLSNRPDSPWRLFGITSQQDIDAFLATVHSNRIEQKPVHLIYS